MSNYSKSDSYTDDFQTPTTKQIRSRLRYKIFDSIQKKQNTVVRSPTSSGKSHLSATTPWRDYPEITGGQPVLHLSPTTDARQSAVKKNEQFEATGQELLGRTVACPIAEGDYDGMDAPDGSLPSDWFRRMCRGRGIPFSVAHSEFEKAHDGDLPCRPCESINQWDSMPRNDDGEPLNDVIFATHQFARAPSLIKNCNVVIDELPDFTLNRTSKELRRPIMNYLQRVDAPTKTWEDLMSDYAHRQNTRLFRHEFERPEQDWYTDEEDAHILAPGIVQAILSAEKQCHDRWKGETTYRYPDLNPHTDSPEYRVQIRIVFDESYNIKMLHVLPDFTEARCVIGLDAYPTEPKWRANTSCNLNFDRILTEKEEQQWRRNERDLEIVQIGSNKNTWTTSGFNEEKVTGVCSELRHRYGEEFNSGITSERFVNDLQDRMEIVGVKDPVTTHYGLEKSVEKFEDEMVGLVAGCISPSSDSIKDWLAMLEKDATPKREIQDNYDGQEWVGTDAAIAHDLIADVREKHVLQSIGRFARSPSDPNDGATVYVMTNILPNQWVDTRVDGVDPLRGKQCEIASVLYETTDGVTPAEIDERVDCSTRHVYKTLTRFEEASWCCTYETEGNNDGDKYHATRDADCIVNLSEI